MFGDDKNKIEELKKVLYSREKFKADNPIHPLPKKTYDVNENWAKEQEPKKKFSIPLPLGKIFVWGSVIFFVLAFAIAVVVYYNGYNTITAGNVDIKVNSSTTLDAGRENTIVVGIDNKNQVELQDAVLTIEYPENARKKPSSIDPLVLERLSLGDVKSGSHIDTSFSAVFFGLQGEQQKVKLTLEYHIPGSTNLFAKTKDYLYAIGTGPIAVNVTHVDQVNSGQDVSFKVELVSNSTSKLSGLALSVLYPFGFSYRSATPSPDFDNNIWRIGSMDPGQKKTITLTGRLEGQENEQRSFRFNVGIANPADQKKIASTFYSSTETVGVKKPFIGLDLAFDGYSTTTYATFAGETINGTLAYGNNTSLPVNDAAITIRFNGAILDRSSVLLTEGSYQSQDNTITWDQRTVPGLASISPGSSGTLHFSFKTLPFVENSAYTKSSQKITMYVSGSATQTTSGGSMNLSSSINRNIAINSNIDIGTISLHRGGPISNTGPIPPEVEKETTYTINWKIKNTFNNVSGVRVSTVLPSYVKFTNIIYPQNERISYNEVTGEVLWDVGNVKTNTGYSSSPREASFQVAIIPSLTQIDQPMSLTGDVKLHAVDAFTGQTLDAMSDSVSTDIQNDDGYKYGDGTVKK